MALNAEHTGPIRVRIGRTGQYVSPEMTLGLMTMYLDQDPPAAGFAWEDRADGERGSVRIALGESAELVGRRFTLIEVDGTGNGSAVVEIGPRA